MKRFLIALSLLLVFMGTSDAQQIIKGKVLDKKGRPKKDISVVIGKDANKAQSDALGNFTMKLDSTYLVDSLLLRELVIMRDTLFMQDSIKISKQIILTDTLRRTDTLVTRVVAYDTIMQVDTIRKRHTVMLVDTVVKTDTLRKHYSVTLVDTVFKIDTVKQHKRAIYMDTIYLTDTVWTRIKITRPVYEEQASTGTPRVHTSHRMPVIGISDRCREGEVSITKRYAEAVLHAGGLPVVIPYMEDYSKLETLLDTFDGLILTGGGDIDPAYYDTPKSSLSIIQVERDPFDFALLRIADSKDIPVLGICRGLQIINVAYGGSLYQDIPTEYSRKGVVHRIPSSKGTATHGITLSEGSLIRRITGKNSLYVNSIHHQAIRRLAPGFKATGFADDGIIEVIESTDPDRRILGVQFHPEGLFRKDPAILGIFEYFIKEARKPR